MTPLQRYIAEEIATDHVEGLLTRREAIRRLALLGVGATAASALIAACGSENKPDNTSAATATPVATSPPPGADKVVATEPITWSGPNGTLQGAWAPAARSRGSVLVIHENKGLNDWVGSVAGRLAGVGYSSLAIDLLSEEGGTSTFKDPAEATAALGKVPSERFIADLKSGVDEILRRVPDKPAGVAGFCFGGGLVWQLLAAGEPRLAAAAPFYRFRTTRTFRGPKRRSSRFTVNSTSGSPRRRMRPRRRCSGQGWFTTSSSSPVRTMPSSTTAAPATTLAQRQMPGSV